MVSKTATPAELVDALERVHRGEQVTPQRSGSAVTFGRWPGDELGLSSRESEVLALICQGFSNKTICDAMFLGSNTIKSYIRSLYRKIERPDTLASGALGRVERFPTRKGPRLSALNNQPPVRPVDHPSR